MSITSQHQFARDVWHDVALSLDRCVAGSRDLFQLFVDGQREGSLTGDFLDIPFFNGTNSGNNFGDLLIGAGNYGGSGSENFRRNYDGLIDEVKLVTTRLSAVPRPGSWALMAGGLLLIGRLVGRRRTTQNG